VFNGAVYKISTLQEINDEPILELKLASAYDGTTTVRVPLKSFTDPQFQCPRELQHFEFGYSLTVHKSQGSEWNSVLLINEAACFGEQASCWLYTGITRAANELTIVNY
jgi:exodeoxyribonuclease V